MTKENSPARSPAGPIARQIPEGDNRERLVCTDCGFINYENPNVVVGAVCTWENKVLLCRRAINPRRGLWTIPAGFMELNETTEAGAAREAKDGLLVDRRTRATRAAVDARRSHRLIRCHTLDRARARQIKRWSDELGDCDAS